jgi:metal-responsive CopG/Arc/MetJ family transcriptional regulator
MKTAISVPDAVFREGERLAKKLGKSRSELYSIALAAFLDAHRRDDVTARLNQVYGGEPSSVDPALAEMQAASIEREDW